LGFQGCLKGIHCRLGGCSSLWLRQLFPSSYIPLPVVDVGVANMHCNQDHRGNPPRVPRSSHRIVGITPRAWPSRPRPPPEAAPEDSGEASTYERCLAFYNISMLTCCASNLDRRLSPCHRRGRIVFCQSRRLHQYTDIQGVRAFGNGQDPGGHLLVFNPSLQLYCLGSNRSTSCYNAFSRVDMRVHAPFPGSVESYCVDERGEKRKTTDELWLETYLCSVLRAYSYADDGSGETIRKIMGVRRFNPVTSTETEHKFLSAAEQLFFRGTGRPISFWYMLILLTVAQVGNSAPIPSYRSRTTSQITLQPAS